MDEENTEIPRKSLFARAVNWLVILLLVLGGFGYLGFKYSLTSVDEIKNWMGNVSVAESKISPPPKQNIPVASPDIEVKETGAVSLPAVAVDAAPAQEIPVVADNEEIAILKENQKYFALYLAARDLRDAKNNPERINAELRHFSVIAGDNPELAGKIDTLSRTIDGLATIAQLRDSLDNLVRNIEKENAKTVWESLKYSVGNLVRVTKIKDEEHAFTAREIKTRAEILLSDGDLNGAIREVQKLGSVADEWVREANNLARVHEYTDFFVDYAKSKIKF